MAEILLNAAIPSIRELCCTVAQIDLSETKDSSAKSDFHWKTMKCRLIIHTMQDKVIACPVYETIASIHIITTIEFFNGDTFQNTLKDMNITRSPPRPVTPEVYANCLRYAMLFAVAPRWNKVGRYLINDRYFLSFSDTLSLRYNLTVKTERDKDAEMTLRVQPLKVHMREFKLDDLRISGDILANFMVDPRAILDIASLGNIYVTVLPSLKRGKLLTALKYIPASCPFKNYGELRRHWKNMYGYRLPKMDSGMIYYEIYFPVMSRDKYLYPEICVRSGLNERLYPNEAETPVCTFARDLTETMSFVCGRPLMIFKDNRPFDDSPKTPEISSGIRGFPNDFRQTARLSFSHSRREIPREPSTLMSPTPSLRGSAKPRTGSQKLRHILTPLKRNPDVKWIFRTNDHHPPGIQNRCPNAVGESSPALRALSSSPITLPEAATSLSNHRHTEMTKPVIIRDEVTSSYFSNFRPNVQEEKTESEAETAATLSQKLERNFRSRSNGGECS